MKIFGWILVFVGWILVIVTFIGSLVTISNYCNKNTEFSPSVNLPRYNPGFGFSNKNDSLNKLIDSINIKSDKLITDFKRAKEKAILVEGSIEFVLICIGILLIGLGKQKDNKFNNPSVSDAEANDETQTKA
ncbi:MAG: hypothetical protein WCT77_02730 [Bacteroidota bacterium]|jgi:hypothetical protein